MADNISDLKKGSTTDQNRFSAEQNWHWSRKQLLGLSPDIITVKATARLVEPRQWEQLGQNETYIWGLFKRKSLSSPHKIFVHRKEFTGHCSCIATKHPCKFFIALLVLSVDNPKLFKTAKTPNWVLQKQRELSQPIPKSLTYLDEVKAGMAEFSRWLRDQLRQGIADFAERQSADLESMANRLIDARLPRIANELRELGHLVTPRKGIRPNNWPELLIKGLGRFYLLTQAWERFDQLNRDEQSDLIQACLPSVHNTYTASRSDIIDDDWFVLGRKFEAVGRKWNRRTWLYGFESQRFALVDEGVSGRKTLLSHFVTGSSYAGPFQFQAGTTRLTGQFVSVNHNGEENEKESQTFSLSPKTAHFSQALAPSDFTQIENKYIKALTINPWLRVFPALLIQVRLHFDTFNNRWLVVDSQGEAVQLFNGKNTGWYLLAASQGRPIHLFGEWSKNGLTLVSVFHDEEWLDLTVWGSRS